MNYTTADAFAIAFTIASLITFGGIWLFQNRWDFNVLLAGIGYLLLLNEYRSERKTEKNPSTKKKVTVT